MLAGYETGDATWAPPPAEPFAAAAAREPGKLRIGVSTSPRSRPSSTRSASAASATPRSCSPRSATRSRSSRHPGRATTCCASSPRSSAPLSRRRPSTAASSPGASRARSCWSRSRGRSGRASASAPRSTTTSARTQLGAFSRQIVAVWDDYDVVLLPSLAQRPLRIGELDPCSDTPWEDFRRSGEFTPYTALFNTSGQPAISLPLYHGDDGLPVGSPARRAAGGRGDAALAVRPARGGRALGGAASGDGRGLATLAADAVDLRDVRQVRSRSGDRAGPACPSRTRSRGDRPRGDPADSADWGGSAGRSRAPRREARARRGRSRSAAECPRAGTARWRWPDTRRACRAPPGRGRRGGAGAGPSHPRRTLGGDRVERVVLSEIVSASVCTSNSFGSFGSCSRVVLGAQLDRARRLAGAR